MQAKKLKANIRAFSGFTWINEEKERASLLGRMNKATVSDLKSICKIVCLEVGGDKVCFLI